MSAASFRRSLIGFAYFDNARAARSCSATWRSGCGDYLLTTSVQTGASYPQSQRAAERLREARARIALLLNATRPEEGSCSDRQRQVLLQFLALSMEGKLRPGDEIVVTDFDHESRHRSVAAVGQSAGLLIKMWSIDPDTLTIALDALDALMSDRTKLVAVTHASNTFSARSIPWPRLPVELRPTFAGAELVVDAVAYAPHRAIDVRGLGRRLLRVQLL